MATGQTVKLPVVNKQIIEIKKKIQLAEGQRKALFEEIEADSKKIADEILRLKKEISKMIIILNDQRKSALKSRMPVSELQSVVGHVGDKTGVEILAILDLHLIDKNKQLDLLNYKVKKREMQLIQLAKEYQDSVVKKEQKMCFKLEQPIEKAIGEMQNKINAIEVQWREAEHVRTRYRDIRRVLQDDAAQFESRIKQAKKELNDQQVEVDKLLQVNAEASKLRGTARNELILEERTVVQSASKREAQAEEGRRLVQERKNDLQRMERRLYQTTKPRLAEGEEDSPKDSETPEDKDPMESLQSAFETLKDATGGSDIDDVLHKFKSQQITQITLTSLRSKSEEMKHKLEKTQENYTNELEKLKFAGTKETEHNVEELECLKSEIQKSTDSRVTILGKLKNADSVVKHISDKLQNIYSSCAPDIQDNKDAVIIINSLKQLLINATKIKEEDMEKMNELDPNEEKWLPPPYMGIIRRTPLPHHGSPTPIPPTVSDDEEEVPSRGFLKRQAQLVVDAKTKRKNTRFQLPRAK